VIGLENRRIIFANNAVRHFFGWSADELMEEQPYLLPE
jgi:PAS domain-containing protein